MDTKTLYASPVKGLKIEDCQFYHTMDIPGHGTVKGEWDLRGREFQYFGNFNFSGKSVLEMGPSSGHLSFFMENQGASVVGYDLSIKEKWDIVPYCNFDYIRHLSLHQGHINRMNNSFWFAREALKSNVNIIYGNIYEIPDDIGMYDTATFGSILLHLRDPFKALQCVSEHVRDTIIVTERFYSMPEEEKMLFLPDATNSRPFDTWWKFTPELIREFLRVLGFNYFELSYNQQIYAGKEAALFTCIAHRNRLFNGDPSPEFSPYSSLPQKHGGKGFIDLVNDKAPVTGVISVSGNEPVRISGWAINDHLDRHHHKLFIELENEGTRNRIYIPAYRRRRDDLKNYFDNISNKYSGFDSAIIDRNIIAPGKYSISVLQTIKGIILKDLTGTVLIIT